MAVPLLLKDVVWSPERDVLERAGSIDLAVDTLRRLPPPGCVALYGAWGSGKSTLLRSVQQRWETRKLGPTIWFDPWEYERREDVISPLLRALVKRAEEASPDASGKIRALAASIAKTLLSLSLRAAAHYAFGASADKRVSWLSDVKLKDFTENFEEWSKYHDEIDETKKDFKRLVDIILEGRPGQTLAVFLDDLDRCLPESVVSLIEATKLLLCGDHDSRVVFMFALDRHIVGEAIAQRFPGSSLYTGESYLEKIFDLSLEVPPLGTGQVEMYLLHLWPTPLTEAFNQVFDKAGGFKVLSTLLSDPVFANPRVIKRVINRIMLLVANEQAHGFVKNLPEPDRIRFLAWLAGSERFRSFRYAFLDSSNADLVTFHERMAGGTDPSNGGELEKIAAIPLFGRYYELLGLRDLDRGRVLKQRWRADHVPPPGGFTIRDFDDCLRAVGL